MTGLLYEKLIVQPSPTLPAYYNMVKRVLQECREDREDFIHKKLWFEKWFGDM